MEAKAFAGEVHGPVQAAFGDHELVAAAPHAGPMLHACCSDAPAVAPEGVSMPNEPIGIAVSEAPMAWASSVLERAAPSRSPPPRVSSERSHILLQIYLI